MAHNLTHELLLTHAVAGRRDRRGEMCALRWSYLDLDAGVMTVRRNYVRGREKDPKNHQMRRISIVGPTVALLREHQAECEKTFALAGEHLDPSSFVSRRRRTDPGRAIPAR